ncbi:MAG TPA: hypothetical protein PKZ32_05935 [Candidatus Melainabacteria bacterium]|nr:hypothetical protein [Candidatus Melainabacteria bacterium]
MSLTLKLPRKQLRNASLSLIGISFVAATFTTPANAGGSNAVPPEVEAIRAQLLQYYQQQSQALRQPNPVNFWQKVAMAPTSFPAPIFSGTETLFIMPKMPQGIKGLQSVHQMILRTKDRPNLVAAWYESRLASSGFKLNTEGPKVNRPGVYVFRAESGKYACNVCVTGRSDFESDTTINITAVEKPAA